MTAREIIEMVAECHGYTREDLIGPSRLREIAWPRQEAMYVIRQVTGYSYPAIGRILGGRDHTTIIKGREACEERMKRKPETAGRVAGFIVEAMGVAAE